MTKLGEGEGFLLLSTGDDRKQWLFNLIDSIKDAYENPPIHVLTDRPLSVDHTLIDARFSYDSRYYKTNLYSYSPFETTIFIDDDALVVRNFGEVSALLGDFDIAMALDPYATLGLWRDNVIERCSGDNAAWDYFVHYVGSDRRDLPYFNSGVIVWRRALAVENLFDRWHRLWADGGQGPDQTWLALAIDELDIKVGHLHSGLNFYPVTEHCVGHTNYPSISEAFIVHFLSDFGKRKMQDLVVFNAPVDRVYVESLFQSEVNHAFPIGSEKKIDLIVARYEEDLRWVCQIPNYFRIVVYNKGSKVVDENILSRIDILEEKKNIGRESETFLAHLISRRSKGAEWLIFTQGDPFQHSPDFLSLVNNRDMWGSVQALSLRWLIERNIPSQYIIDCDRKDWIDGLRVRRELFSLRTWAPLYFHDPGTVNIMNDYLERYALPHGFNIAEHFLEMAGWSELADSASVCDVGLFSYGGIFLIAESRFESIPPDSLYTLWVLSQSHPVHGYIIERLWLHFFGLPFSAVTRPTI